MIWTPQRYTCTLAGMASRQAPVDSHYQGVWGMHPHLSQGVWGMRPHLSLMIEGGLVVWQSAKYIAVGESVQR